MKKYKQTKREQLKLPPKVYSSRGSLSYCSDMIEDNIELPVIRVCYACDSHSTYMNPKTGHLQWYGNPPIGWLCKTCNTKYITNPEWHPITNKLRIRFLSKQLYIEQNPKIGVCNWCRAVKGQINTQLDKLCKQTHMNHESYHENNILKDTIEVCSSCHRRYHENMKKNIY